MKTTKIELISTDGAFHGATGNQRLAVASPLLFLGLGGGILSPVRLAESDRA